MIALQTAKRALAAVAVVATFGLVGLVLLGLTTALVATTTGADPSDAFTEVPIAPADLDELVSWERDADDLIRSVEPTTRIAVGSAWIRAITALEVAVATGETRAVETWFSVGAKQRALDLVQDATGGPRWRHHVARVNFYSLDGQVLQLTIRSSGSLVLGDQTLELDDSFDVVMVLRDGNWRVERLSRVLTNP